jgi:hypothetical protein
MRFPVQKKPLENSEAMEVNNGIKKATTRATVTVKSAMASSEEEYGFLAFAFSLSRSIRKIRIPFCAFAFLSLHIFLILVTTVSVFFSIFLRNDQNGAADCAAHYSKAQVDGTIFELGNCVHVNVSVLHEPKP